MNGWSTTVLGAVAGFFLGGVLARALSSALGLVAVITALTTVALRSYAALTAPRHLRSAEFSRRLERATGAGAAIGFALSLLALLLDALIGG